MGFWSKLFGFGKSTCSCSCACGDLWKDVSLTDKDKKILKELDEHIVVAKVLRVEPHSDPKITKVQITRVSIGSEELQVLCGGTNVAEGQIVPLATVGAKLSEDFEIGVRKIRGVESHGMICARAELGLSPADEHKGQIWSLPSAFESVLGKSLRSIS